jgi:putative membrane protein
MGSQEMEHSLREVIIRFFKGVLIGIGMILPGLSGGVLAVIFGIYDPLMRFLGNLRKNFWERFRFFLPAGIGGIVGIYLFSIAVEAAFGRYKALFTCLFIGFVAGTLPHLYATAGRLGRKPKHLFITFISAALIFALMLLGDRTLVTVEPNLIVWLLSGAVVGLGAIVPGLSPSNFLIYFGLYDKMAGEIKALNLSAVIPLAVGVIGIVLLLAKLVNRLIDRHETIFYHVILGTVIGSSAGIIPAIVLPALTPDGVSSMGLSLASAAAIAAGMFIFGTLLSYLFSRLEAKTDRPAFSEYSDGGKAG